MFGLNQLGAVTGSVSPGGDAEWNAYFSALRDNMNARWQRAVDSYKTLKSVRETLGLPFMAEPGQGEGPIATGAWSADLEQQAVNIHAMTVLITGALDDVVANKRKIGMLPNSDEWVIERLPSDILRIEVKAPGTPVLVNAATGQPEQVQGTVGALWSSAALAVLVPGAGIYLTLRAIDNLVQNTQEKTAQTIAKRNGDLIASGKATPEQAAALTKAEAEAAAGLVKARGEAKKTEGVDPEKWTPLVKTVVWGALGLGALFLLIKVLPSGGTRSLATNPVKSNPGRRKKKLVPCDPSVWVYFNGGDDIRELHQAIKSRASKFGKVSVGGMGSGFGGDDINFCVESEAQAKKIARDLDGAVVHGVRLRAEVLHSERGRIPHLEAREMNPMLSSGNWSSPKHPVLKYHLERVPLNREGYTKTGRYFGVGKPLYEYESTDGQVHGFLRASSRAEAKQHLRDEQGGARFFNPLFLV